MKNKKMILMGVICALSFGLAVTTYADKNADLRNAAERGDLTGVIRALDRGAYVNDANMDNETALLLAIKRGHENVVHYLVEEVEGTSECDGDAMWVAYKKGDFPMMQYLYDHGMTTLYHPVDKFKECIEKHFCYAGLSKGDTTYRFEIAKFIFEKYLKQKPAYNYTNCKYIIDNDYRNYEFSDENICELIDNKFIAKGDKLYTYAYSKGYTHVCEKLKNINKDIKFDLKSANKEELKNIISKALNQCDKETLTTIINSGYVDNVNELFKYINFYKISESQNFNSIKFLLSEMKADIDYVDINGATLLYRAIAECYPTIVQFLLDNNANIYIKGGTSYPYNTALEYAKKCSKKEFFSEFNKLSAKKIVELLEEAEKKNPNPNAKPKKKSCIGKLFSKKSDKKTSTVPVSQKSAVPAVETDSPLATQTSTAPIKKPSIPQKSLPVTPNAPTVPLAPNINANKSKVNANNSINTANNDETTDELFDGIFYNQFIHVKRAVDNNKECVNAKNRDGKTALMLAVEKEQIEIIKFLIQNGADVNATFAKEIRPGYRKKTTVFMLAKNPEIRQILSRAGAVG